MLRTFEIKGEDDLLSALKMIENGEWTDDLAPCFVDWPQYEISIDGEDFDGGIPTRVIPALEALRRTMNRAYARSVHGSPRRLNSQERRQAQLIIRLEPGSTKFIVALSKLLNAAFQNMNGQQKVQTIVAVAALFALSNVRTAEIEAQTEQLEIRAQQLEIQKQISDEAQETMRLQVVAGLVSSNSELNAQMQEMNADMMSLQREWLKRLDNTDSLVINGTRIEAKASHPEKIELPPKREQILSNFRILAVDSVEAGQGFRMQVVNVNSGERFRVSVSEQELPHDELETLQHGIWAKAALQMQIDAERRGGKVHWASLLSVQPAPARQS